MAKRILNILLILILLSGIILLSSFAHSKQKKLSCKRLFVNMNYPSNDILLQSENITAEIYRVFDSLEGKQIKSLDLTRLENHLLTMNGIANAHVYSDLEGNLHIDIWQQQPILRIITLQGNHYYLDIEGEIFQPNTGLSARIAVASGNINQSDIIGNDNAGNLLETLYQFGLYLHEEPFFNKQIEQIFVTETGEYELVPTIGKHLIIFGDSAYFKQKFNKLKMFYLKGITRTDGWKKYKSINLKFKDQIVCTKR